MLVRETIPFGAMLCLDFKCQQVYGLGTCRAAVLGGSFLLPEVPSPWAACCTASTTRSFVVRLLLKFPDSDEEGIAQMLLPKFQDFFSHCLWAHRLEKGKTGLFSRKGKFQSNGSSNNKEWGRERWGLSAAAAALWAPSSPALAAPRAWCCARGQFLLRIKRAPLHSAAAGHVCISSATVPSQPHNVWGLVTLLLQMPVWVILSF